jgi:uncharacterized protein YndB with AHSA1/START domain
MRDRSIVPTHAPFVRRARHTFQMHRATRSHEREHRNRLQETIVTPTDIDRIAPAVVRIERTIAAPPERLWQLQTDVAAWPSWQKDIATATLAGPFAAGNSFTWTSAGLDTPIVSTIYAVEAEHAILWGGPSAGIDGIHRWTFDAAGVGTRVTTEESWAGAAVEANPTEARKMLAASLDRWLDFLTAASVR